MDTTLRSLVDLRDRTLQKARIGFGNRIFAAENGNDQSSAEIKTLIEKWQSTFLELEKEADKDIAQLASDLPIVKQMVCLKGIKFTLAAKVAAMIDIERADSVSALWRYSGYGVIDGERERPIKGETLHYNTRLKTTLYLVAISFLRCNSPYRKVYDSAKAYYEANRPDWTKAHRHNAAMRRMTKTFLAHLWERWRILEGLPTRPLYVNDKLGHENYYPPEQFGWPEVKPRDSS